MSKCNVTGLAGTERAFPNERGSRAYHYYQQAQYYYSFSKLGFSWGWRTMHVILMIWCLRCLTLLTVVMAARILVRLFVSRLMAISVAGEDVLGAVLAVALADTVVARALVEFVVELAAVGGVGVGVGVAAVLVAVRSLEQDYISVSF
jgi:hypothetical protein